MEKKVKVSLSVGVASAVVAVVLGHLYMARFERETSGGPAAEVLSLVKDVPAGSTITDAVLGIRRVPMAYVDDRAILARDKDRVVGIDTVLPLKSQQVLQWSDLAVRSDIRNLSQIVTPGKRGVTVQATRANASGNKMIRPGDFVDVIVTLPSTTGAGRVSLVLLQKVLVIAVGLRTEQLSGDGNVRDDSVLTLSLEVEEAQLIALATEQGVLSVAVRNPEDQRVYEDLPDMASNALVQARDGLRARKRDSAATSGQPTRLQAMP